MRISASRMDALKAKVAIIQPRLRVWILSRGFERGVFEHGLPPPSSEFSRSDSGDREAGRRSAALEPAPHATFSAERARFYGPPFIPFGTTVLV